MKPRQQHRYGQALMEFALAAPILLFLVMGILDFGRVIFAYAMASNSIRSALRNAEVLGYEATATYLDTDTMNQTVRNVFFVNGQTVTIRYLKADGTNFEITRCEWNGAGALVKACNIGDRDLENGDMLQIQSEVTVNFITPLVNRLVPNLTLNFEGQRTIVKNIALNGGEDKNDTDYDGLDDDWERAWFGDLSQTGTDDWDGDGCNNGCEETRKTFPKEKDSDKDGLWDGEEIYTYGTNPNKWDTDDDGLNDYDEIKVWKTDPLDDDSDDDKLKDGVDLPSGDGNDWVTYPLNPDSDDDGVLDGDEVEAGTDPNKKDSDDDGLSDYEELVTYHTNALWWDSDNDGLSDKLEVDPRISTDPWNPDTDDDGLWDGDDLREAIPGDDANDWDTDPHLADSDGDSLTVAQGYERDWLLLDGQETAGCTRPDMRDTDGDWLTDAEELFIYGTNPCPGYQDTDGDGASDWHEVKMYHTNPLVPNPPSDFGDNLDLGDSDNDGLMDSWEKTFFGNLDQVGTNDPDKDRCDNFCEQNSGTNPMDPDTDHDRLGDYDEIYKKYLTLPYNADTDNDKLPDGDEVLDYGTYPHDPDTDDDLLTDYEELKVYGTNPLLPDTDGDGLTDYEELKTYGTKPLLKDTDGDGLTDYEELKRYGTDPLKKDTDGDTLEDGAEISTYKTDPTKPDTDGDGLTDGAEVKHPTYKTDPNMADTDQDGLSDYAELVTYKTNPLNPDTDGDGLADGAEVNHPTYKTDPLKKDTDGDGLNDGDELFTYHTNPLNVDTDGEKLKDGEEAAYKCNPLVTDTDGDGLNDYSEVYTYHTFCDKADSDNDGVSDGDELKGGTLPNNPIAVSIDDIIVTEASNMGKKSRAVFTVTLSNPSPEVTIVYYSTMDGSAVSYDTPTSLKDYTSSRGLLTFKAGATEQTIEITITRDYVREPTKEFFVKLLDPVNAYLGKDTGICTILDDD